MSGPRPAKTERTRERIQLATVALFLENAALESITFKAVAQRAGVAEMTVFRYFPTREQLLRGLWEHLYQRLGDSLGMPRSEHELRDEQRELFRIFDTMPEQVLASIATPEGRAIRAASNHRRRAAFLAIVEEVADDLNASEKTRTAAVLQFLHSAYAWAALREHWGFSGEESGKATLWAIDSLLSGLKRKASRTRR
jgi:AcrR family transcriptional regulator